MGENRSILICDDDDSIRRLILAILAGDGYEMRQAPDVESAVAALDAAAPDLVILDVKVPGEGGGLGVLQHIRTAPELSGVKVLLVTGVTQAQNEDWGRSMGADAQLLKPFELEALRTAVRELVAP